MIGYRKIWPGFYRRRLGGYGLPEGIRRGLLSDLGEKLERGLLPQSHGRTVGKNGLLYALPSDYDITCLGELLDGPGPVVPKKASVLS